MGRAVTINVIYQRAARQVTQLARQLTQLAHSLACHFRAHTLALHITRALRTHALAPAHTRVINLTGST